MEHFDAVAAIVCPRRRRVLSEEQRARLVETGRHALARLREGNAQSILAVVESTSSDRHLEEKNLWSRRKPVLEAHSPGRYYRPKCSSKYYHDAKRKKQNCNSERKCSVPEMSVGHVPDLDIKVEVTASDIEVED